MEGRVLTLRTTIVRARSAALIACLLVAIVVPLSAVAEQGIPAGSGAVITGGAPLLVRATPGWDAEVYAANDVPDSIEGWGEPIGAENDLGEEEAIGLDTGGEEFTQYLLWITSLPEGGRAEIAELTLRQ